MTAKSPELIDRLLGQNIRFQRAKRQLSQTELGEAIQFGEFNPYVAWWKKRDESEDNSSTVRGASDAR